MSPSIYIVYSSTKQTKDHWEYWYTLVCTGIHLHMYLKPVILHNNYSKKFYG